MNNIRLATIASPFLLAAGLGAVTVLPVFAIAVIAELVDDDARIYAATLQQGKGLLKPSHIWGLIIFVTQVPFTCHICMVSRIL